MTGTSIGSIAEEVSACTRCGLCMGRRNAVPGMGGTESRILIVGEAPGRREDEEGRPFVGRAGEILSDLLHGAGISRESVYITNVVKCRPPGNRVPTISERDACSIHLAAEIEVVRPRIICIMGATAFRSLLDGNEIGRHRGTILKRDGIDYMVMYHPAAAIYNRRLLPTMKKDMERLAGIIQ